MDALLHDTSFWVAVAFVIFVALVWRPLGRIVTKALDDRADQIRSDLDEAAKLREEAQSLLASYKRKQRDAEKETEEMLDNAKREAQRIREQATADLEATLKRREQQALDRIAQAEASAAAEVRGMAVDLAIQATRKLLTENITEEKAAALIEQSVKEVDEKLH